MNPDKDKAHSTNVLNQSLNHSLNGDVSCFLYEVTDPERAVTTHH